MPRKVWVEVEVEDGRPGEETPRLIGGVDVAAAREAYLALRVFHVEFVPEGFAEEPGYEPGDEKAPFFSEAFLYVLLGKEDARSLLGRMRTLRKALGISNE
jgi:hypothetical protein